MDNIDTVVSYESEPKNSLLESAYQAGFLRAAEWTNRDDLRADLDSPAYAKDRERDLDEVVKKFASVATVKPSR